MHGINDSIGRLGLLFALLFAILAARTLYVQVIEGPSLPSGPYKPRAAYLAPYRGAIVARDGTILERSSPHGRVYPFGPSLAQTLGYVSLRYGTTGLEPIYARATRVVLDPATGEVLAIPSLPSLDPATIAKLFTSISKNTQRPLVNRGT